ncbi:ribonuclease HI [Burkholderia vietnamiensis]|uniref:ribonuclease HI n=1 Tax=Burkholderia vietnamiensis TaxID=60552 RepID=UPI001CC5AF21|nr:RNase H family protein [Burkholderia vietnamiensis]HDR9086283.1 hypothetical protein [Burkholderia vietnamiensis]
MLVTIIADASWDPQTRAGGYGYWAVSLRGRHSGGGAFKSLVLNNNVAEMMAVMNGLHMAFARQIACPGDTILAQTDCQAAILAFEGKRSLNLDERMVVEGLKTMLEVKQATIQFRHVKGHTRGEKPRLWVNNRCDALAKTGMREARALLSGGVVTDVVEKPKRAKPSPKKRADKRKQQEERRLQESKDLRAFAFEEKEESNHVGTGVLSIPPWEEQELPEQCVARDGMGVPVAA